MKHVCILLVIISSLISCATSRVSDVSDNSYQYTAPADTVITQSLFSDRNATISEEGIQKVLAGTYALPQQLRVAIVKLENPQLRNYYWYSIGDENYLKNQQAYMDSFSLQFKRSPRVTKIMTVPDLLVSKTPSFTNIREAAVRMQADIVVVYSITGDIYSKYRFFSKADIKAYATTQLVIMDVRTGLVTFSAIATKDYLSQKNKDELEHSEARNRVQNQAVLLTIGEISQKIAPWLQGE